MVTPHGPRVILIGPPGAGKTTVGAVLAQRLGLPLRDTDQAIENRAGCSVSDIFIDRGEPAFRALEREELAAAITEHGGVLSVGGGAVMDQSSARALAGHTVVYLRVGIADAAKRVGFDRSRPMMAINPRGQWVRLLELRKATYERLATLTVDTGGRTPDDVADQIAQHLGEPT